MDIPTAILEILKCGVCGAQLSRGPVYLQDDGAALCNPCFTPKKKATRNIQYEALAQLHVFPCKYKDLGCEDKVPFVQGSEVIPHEEVCEHRQWVCPVLGSARCDWLGPRAQLLQHCEDQHQDLVLQSPSTLQPDIRKSNEKTYLLRMLQVLFLLHVKVSVAAGKIYHSVRFLGRTDEAKDFLFNLHIKRKNETITKEGEVAPQGCLAIQEDTSLSLDINGLLSVLGGFDGAMFTVEVQRRVREMSEMCAGCGTQITALVYKDDRGWVCERCAPARRACDDQADGCSHEDVVIKCHKHESFFCELLTRCYVCDKKDVERGSLSAHRRSACLPVCRVGATLRATRAGLRWCLVDGAAGIAVCMYSLDKAEFGFYVNIPVTSERLREFGCVVRVTQPATGLMRTYTPEVAYDDSCDWHIKVEKNEFPKWDCVFDVSVDITKILV